MKPESNLNREHETTLKNGQHNEPVRCAFVSQRNEEHQVEKGKGEVDGHTEQREATSHLNVVHADPGEDLLQRRAVIIGAA